MKEVHIQIYENLSLVGYSYVSRPGFGQALQDAIHSVVWLENQEDSK